MEKGCEFCKGLKATVYCKADAAYLCLSCDSKVHSANALSFRHPRTLVCQSCSYQPAIVRCFVHRIFVCQSCDDIMHRHHDDVGGFRHQKKVLDCYMGCPSARDLASLWGFDFNELKNNNSIECEGGSSSRGAKVVENDERDENSYSIVQQNLYLERLQLYEEIKGPDLVHLKEHKNLNNNNVNKKNKNNNNQVVNFDGNLEIQQTKDSLDEKNDERLLSSPFSQLDNLTSNNNGNHLHGDSFWQYKTPPSHNNEIWLQNMQDLGVCDEVQCFDDDDVTIPDVDLTFRNFEELFGNEHEPSFNFDQFDPSYGGFDRGFGSTFDEHYNDYQLPTMISPTFYDQELLPHESSYNSKKSNMHGNENVIMRSKEKKSLRHEKQAYYASPKSKSDIKKRGKGEVC